MTTTMGYKVVDRSKLPDLPIQTLIGKRVEVDLFGIGLPFEGTITDITEQPDGSLWINMQGDQP
jgi:hypothetical protein